MQTRQPVKSKVTAQLGRIPSGKAGVIATLKIMRNMIRTGKTSLPVRLLALDLTSNLQQKNYSGEISEIFYFVRDRIRYVKDIDGVETLQTPDKTLELKAGDCDDKSILLASMLQAIGHPVRLVAVGFKPGVFCHVFVQTKIGTKWVSLETTEPQKLGWEPPRALERLVMKV